MLLEHTLDLIREEGPDRFTLREVARRAGVSHAAPYRHFPTKGALLAAVAGEGSTMLRSAVEQALASTEEAREQFLAAGLAYVRFALEHPAHFKVMFFAAGAYEADPASASARDASLDLLLSFIRDAQRQGLVRAGEPAKLAIPIWSMHHGLACLASAGHVDITPRALRRTVEDAHADLLDGLVPRKPSTARR